MSELAVVTGASKGIGRAISLLFAREGYRVLALARSEGELASMSEEAKANGGGTIIPCAVDLTDEAALDERLDAALREHGPASVLINNAGYGIRGALEDVPVDACRRLFEVNVFSLLRVTQKVLPGMRAARFGTIVNISSVAGLVSNPFGGHYCASKFALEALSDSLRMEMRPWGVRVVLIEPGPVRTHFTSAANEVSDAILDNPTSAYASWYPKLRDGVRSLHAMAITSEDVAQTVLRAVKASKPKARYKAHKLLLYVPPLLRRLAPSFVLDSILAKRLGLGTTVPAAPR